MSEYIVAPQDRIGRVFGWLLAFAFGIGPLAWLAYWSASYTVAVRGCEATAVPPPLMAPVQPEGVMITFILMSLATAGVLCAISAWRSLRLKTAALNQQPPPSASPTRFFTLCAIAGGLLFVIVIVFNAVGLALLPVCA